MNKSHLKIFAAPLILMLVPALILAQGLQKKVVINWTGIQTIQGINYESLAAMCADGLSNNASKNYTPEYFEKFRLPENAGSCEVKITDTEWEIVSDSLVHLLTYPLQPEIDFQPVVDFGNERGLAEAMLTLVPVMVNAEGAIMRLRSFTINMVYLPEKLKNAELKSTTYATHSVLAQGNWYKVSVDKTGIYKITYADLQAMGVNMASVNPNSIRLFGNGGGILPEANNVSRFDDLTENAISVVTSNAGVFASGDYILFYGTSPHKSVYNKSTRKFEHVFNIYSDYTYYYLNFDGNPGLRITDEQQSTLLPTYTCTSFTEATFYEKDMLNFINSGKDWVGERMDAANAVFELPEFAFANITAGKTSSIRYRVTSKSSNSTTYTVKINGVIVGTPSCIAAANYNYATDRIETKLFTADSDKLRVGFQYNGTGASIGWLDWVELNVPRNLKFTGGQMMFSDPESVSVTTVSDFQLQASNANVTVWDVSNPVKVRRVLADLQSDVSRFVLKTDSLKEFVAWDNTKFLSVKFIEKVANQDLHGIASTDMLIVTNKDFLEQANRLADHHRIFDGLRVNVVTNQQVYNEFSSGSPDIAAIRDFARLMYQRPKTGDKLHYLLLFGDGSFDFKDRVPNNTNRVLTFQTKESLNSVYSYASDDFYGILDSNEGNDAVGLIDIGIGRFPVNTEAEAKMAVDKCIFYATNSTVSLGDWRNKLCFVADNGNSNTHFRQVEKQICPLIGSIAPVFNLDKIYIDAYAPVSTPSGQRCPDANAGITSNVQNGVLMINYTGHGGETGWAEEGILTVREIDSWTNYNNMPVFMTATCEFSRYDDPARVSAGEHVFLNPAGGGIALFTTTRLANAGTNIGLTLYFYDTLFSNHNGEYPRFGDVIAYAKNKMGGSDASLVRNFVLLGDPALRLAYPKYTVVTTKINGRDLNQVSDTIPAMKPVEIKGVIADASGNKVSGFSGILEVKIFDKVRTLKTLGSLAGDYPDKYTVQDNYIYQGKATITNGDFTFNFVVPRDIDYSYGPGKISYYAHNDYIDANGFCKQLVIGGSSSVNNDTEGPQIALFMDDLSFVNGGVTGESPLLIANLNDISGINTIGNGIGHDIVVTVDGDNSSSVVMNGYYNADLDSYQSGVLNYRLSGLSEGAHTLTLKVWDVFNNSTEVTIRFVVEKMVIKVFPNPFTNDIKVEFKTNQFDRALDAYLQIYNLNGMLVAKTPVQKYPQLGYKEGEINWDGRTASGAKVPPGIYMVVLNLNDGNTEMIKANRVVKLK